MSKPKPRSAPLVCKPPPIGCGAIIGRIKNVITWQRFRESGLCKSCQDKVFKR